MDWCAPGRDRLFTAVQTVSQRAFEHPGNRSTAGGLPDGWSLRAKR